MDPSKSICRVVQQGPGNCTKIQNALVDPMRRHYNNTLLVFVMLNCEVTKVQELLLDNTYQIIKIQKYKFSTWKISI